MRPPQAMTVTVQSLSEEDSILITQTKHIVNFSKQNIW